MSAASLSARRAWIEIGVDFSEDWLNASLSARRAWIEIGSVINENRYKQTSLSARRAWIEILLTLCPFLPCRVALRKESVDRNYRLHY